MPVILVCGPPCAGKSTYVRQHAQPGDLVLDQDVIGTQAMGRALRSLHHVTGTAWVIRCCPGPRRREALARRLNATDVVLLRPPVDVLRQRAAARPDPRRTLAQIRYWHTGEARDASPRGPAQPKANTTERGYGAAHDALRRAAIADLKLRPGRPCPHCRQPMYATQYLDLDHTADRQGYRGLAHRGCNRRDGAVKRWTRHDGHVQSRTSREW